MNIEPIHDRVLIEPIEDEAVSVGGVILIDGSDPDGYTRGRVEAVGPGRLVNDERVPVQVEVGDEVYFHSMGGTEFDLDGRRLRLVREDEIPAIIG